MKVTFVASVFAVLTSFTTAKKYVWPSEYDEIEEIFSLQGGYLSRRFADGEFSCRTSSCKAMILKPLYQVSSHALREAM